MGHPPGSSNFDTVVTTYDALGRIFSVALPCGSTASQPCSAAAKTTTYDALNRALTVTDGGNGTTSYQYIQNDVLVTVGPPPSGEHTKQRQLEYDGIGRLTSVCEITSAAGSGYGPCQQSNPQTGLWTKYTYGNVRTVVQNAQSGAVGGQQTRTYSYDGLGRLLSETNPEWGPGTATYTYDSACGSSPASAGDLTKKVDNAGNTTCYAYDALHRKTGATYPSGPNSSSTPAKTYLYDTTTFSCTNGAYVKGRLAEAFTGPSSAKITDIAYCYSPQGETTDAFESTLNSGGYYHTTASYFANGALQTLGGIRSYTGWTFNVDGEGRPWTAIDQTAPKNLVTNTAYNAASQPTGVSLGSGDSDTYTYDQNTGRMATYQYKVGSTPKYVTGTLGWNPNWSLGSLVIADAFDSANAQTCGYSYDDLARLQSVSCGPTSPNGATWGQTFSYDAFGNISKSGSITFAASYLLANGTTNNQEQTVSTCAPTYDGNGNLTSDCTFIPSYTYAWDSDANIVGINLSGSAPISLTYDAFDRAVEEDNSGTYKQVLYSPTGGKLALMSKQNASHVFLPLPGGEQATYTNQTIRFRHYDWLGSARFESNMSEQEYGDVAYAPFGETYSIRNTPYLSFTGQQQDTISGLYDFPYREYNPTQGRWISPDPAGFQAADPSNPQSWNRYAYVVNNPLSIVDADGLQGPPPPCVLGGKTTPNGLWPALVGENPDTTGDADAPPPCSLDWALSADTYFNTRNRQSVQQDEANYVQEVNQARRTPPPGTWVSAGPGHPGCFLDKGQDAFWCPGLLAPGPVSSHRWTLWPAGRQCTSPSCHDPNYVKPKTCDVDACTPQEKAEWCKNGQATTGAVSKYTGGHVGLWATALGLSPAAAFLRPVLVPLAIVKALNGETGAYFDKYCSQ